MSPPRRASAASPRSPHRCTATTAATTARTAALADQCEATTFMTVVAGRLGRPSGRAAPFSGHYVEENPEQDRDHCQEVAHGGEAGQGRLEPLDDERFLIGGRLLHEGDRWDEA